MEQTCKTCMDCKQEKEISLFKLVRDSKSGKFYHRNRCQPCYKTYDVERNKKNLQLKLSWKKRHSKDIYQKEKANGKQEKARQEYKKYKARYVAAARARELRCKEQTLSCVELSEIQRFYIESEKLQKETGTKYNVDHIIPLKHKNVCGLNVPWNLQILTESENKSKKNKFDGTNDNTSWKK